MLTVFMEYKIIPETLQSYEYEMVSVIRELENLGATDIQWYRAADQPSLYVEYFKVSDKEMYASIKEKRTSNEHPIFSKLFPFVSGGAEKIHCWAFEKLNIKEDL
ncbi:hypothetical protein [Fictibacillus phosphorivorans]|uniref:hypothetical protein n=1 Tax=Fictibacillus phosphorivorans TaxID=1221500 RepID=UPI0020409E78|nr:hypothetical protein [Fictibacillus phosphorivorans]MCM3719979.1 hypothetical protein [Fictibacillus phosphorivorans]MCM3777664.1 hypothetical protein [Fictibacillus phosphorivorans]